MTLMPLGISDALWRIAPAPLRSRLQTSIGKRFSRFVLVAVVSLATSEIALAVFLYGPAHLTGGISGGMAAAVGAAVSYVLSRWAWERKGRPQLLRETLPFWLVSAGVWVALGAATKLGIEAAELMRAHGVTKAVVIGGVYFAANCLTFMARFLIFHFLLFAERGSRVDALAVAEGDLPDRARSAGPADPGQATRVMGSARVNATSNWAAAPVNHPAAPHAGVTGNTVPEPGTRR
jgi:putative flippase GtrA